MIEVVAAVLQRDNQFLICQRPADKACALLWEFAGGKIEAGETPEQALVRECQEELGVTITVGPLYRTVTHEYDYGTVHLRLYHATLAAGEPQRLEHAALRWVTAEQLLHFPFCPADIEIIERLVQDETNHAVHHG